MVLAVEVRVRQVLRNLLSNAGRSGGKSIDVSVHADAASAHVRVVDDGPGVPAGEEESILLPYRRATTRKHKNSVGLGLWISRRLAIAMSGDLTYRHHSAETTFDFSLPIHTLPLSVPTTVAIVESA